MEETAQTRGRSKHRRVCPECGQSRAYRSRRRGVTDYLLGILGLRPYRCRECEHRFHARRGSRPRRRRSPWAQCPRCGFENPTRIARKKVSHTWRNLPWRFLPFSAYRCPECRKRFFDYRSRRPEEAEPPKTS